MAEELWNKINIPFPSAVSVYRIPFSEEIDTVLQCVVAESEKFLNLFCSEVLQTEVRVLYEVLYVLNNSLRQHKPFRALKQLEQCINRVKEMNLQEALQDFWEACPKKPQRSAGLELGECDVPSQACVEWVCVKMLGGAGLLSRLLDRCSRAFILCRQHMQTGEFLVLNLVLISMLARLWVLFRGLLRALSPLYQHSVGLLQQVASARPLPYLSGAPLPRHLAALLGPRGAPLLETGAGGRGVRGAVRRASRASLLSRLFGQVDEGGEEGERKRRTKRSLGVRKARRLTEDLGSIVLQRRAGVSGEGAELDIKSLLMGTRTANTQMTSLTNQKQSSCRDSAVIGQKRRYVKLLSSATSFGDLAANLQEVMRWCRDRKLVWERRRLAFMCLKCRRMVSLETDGQSVKGKLRWFQRAVRRALMSGSCPHPRPLPRRCHSLRTLWRQALGVRGSSGTSRTFLNQRRTSTRRGRTGRAGSAAAHSVSGKNNVLPQQPVTSGDFVQEEPTGSEVLGNRKSSPAAIEADEDDIDDIFASIGF
ncbi:hypothetical protein ACEWY4_022649 [Coilia grayii]|uniref:Nucleolus and neural progenitor protein-like N-terminal domain-containing protein n=1 Tax=Coilia grayii TaxID=363190 RepID=A0ABD1J3V2_9TELE